MTTLTYHIPAISCGHCVHTIQMELGELAGVQNVIGDPASKDIQVVFDAPATREQIEKLLVEINYPPEK